MKYKDYIFGSVIVAVGCSIFYWVCEREIAKNRKEIEGNL
jgi:lipoprotein